MSKSLIRLVDEAILPAFLIVGSKIIAIAAITDILSLRYYYQNLFTLYYTTPVDSMVVSTWSDIVIYAVMLFGVIVILVKLLYFTEGKTNPAVVLKLAKANKLGFIQASVDLYHSLFIWMLFLTGITIYLCVRIVAGIDPVILAIPVLVFYLGSVWVAIKEAEKDISKKLEAGKHELV